MRVIVADDAVLFREGLARVLTDAGFEVTTVGDAESALAQLLMSRPDLFLLDINLPGMHGLALAEKLQSQKGTMSIPVVILSVRTDPRDKVAAFASGAVTYLEKPFKKKDLVDAVRSALELAVRRGKRRFQ